MKSKRPCMSMAVFNFKERSYIMDFRVLSFEQTDFSKNISGYASGCYFDWITLKRIEVEGERFLGKKCYEELLNIRQTSEQCNHIQEMMLLMSDDIETQFPDSPDVMYISMVNIPMWNESTIKESEKYADCRKRVYELINTEIRKFGNYLKLYHTFDHCDFVLLCDATRIGLKQYMKILQGIRLLTVAVDDETNITAVHDVTTIYGYNRNCKDEIKTGDEVLNLIVNLSLKSPDFSEIKFTEIEPMFMTDMVGRYDKMLVWNNINAKEAYNIIYNVQKNTKKFFAYGIYIGCNLESVNVIRTVVDAHEVDIIDTAEQFFKKVFTENFKKRLKMPLVLALNEIHSSIKSMVNRGFAQYYILAFCESFYSFVRYLFRLLIEVENKDEKVVDEKVYDMYRTYFSFLNSLDSCTLHSERQFLQTDSYHLLYFDAPPKLFSFYTAMANKMARALNGKELHNYKFLITPDFKKDIYVDSLTNDQTKDGEHNILIIHIAEESVYDISTTLKILAHEIAHHIGQSHETRISRSEKYIRCFLAYAISNAFVDDFLIDSDDFNERYCFFKNFVEHLADLMFEKNWNKEHKAPGGSDDILHYTNYLRRAFIDHMSKTFGVQNNNLIYMALKKTLGEKLYERKTLPKFWEEVKNRYVNSEDKRALDDFVKKEVAYIMEKQLRRWLSVNHSPRSYNPVVHVFQESYADSRMVELTMKRDVCAESYYNAYVKRRADKLEYDEVIRFAAVLTTLCAGGEKHTIVKEFEKLEIVGKSADKDKQDLRKCAYLYIRDSVAEYLSLVPKIEDENCKKAKSEIVEVINAFEGEIDLKKIVTLIDREIFDYRTQIISGLHKQSETL